MKENKSEQINFKVGEEVFATVENSDRKGIVTRNNKTSVRIKFIDSENWDYIKRRKLELKVKKNKVRAI